MPARRAAAQPPRRACVPAQVDGVALLKQVVIRVSDSGTTVDVVIGDEDTATVRHNGDTTTLPSSREEASTPFGDGIVTIERFFASVTRGGQYAWRVTFTAGDCVADDVDCYVTVWPTRNAGNKARGAADENVALWTWINLPSTMTGSATGVCTSVCQYKPKMPYEWCDGDANCLPTNVDDMLFTQLEIDALEETCGFASGDSRRPSTCTNRILNSEVACNCVDKQEFSGSHDTCKDTDEPAVLNTAVHKKWPMNQDIFNGAHSSCASDSVPPAKPTGGPAFDYAYKLADSGFNVCPSSHP